MNHFETTIFSIMAAVGMAVHDVSGFPTWVNLLGRILMIAGTTGLGFSAASTRGVTKVLENRSADNDTKFVKKTDLK